MSLKVSLGLFGGSLGGTEWGNVYVVFQSVCSAASKRKMRERERGRNWVRDLNTKYNVNGRLYTPVCCISPFDLLHLQIPTLQSLRIKYIPSLWNVNFPLIFIFKSQRKSNLHKHTHPFVSLIYLPSTVPQLDNFHYRVMFWAILHPFMHSVK